MAQPFPVRTYQLVIATAFEFPAFGTEFIGRDAAVYLNDARSFSNRPPEIGSTKRVFRADRREPAGLSDREAHVVRRSMGLDRPPGIESCGVAAESGSLPASRLAPR